MWTTVLTGLLAANFIVESIGTVYLFIKGWKLLRSDIHQYMPNNNQLAEGLDNLRKKHFAILLYFNAIVAICVSVTIWTAWVTFLNLFPNLKRILLTRIIDMIEELQVFLVQNIVNIVHFYVPSLAPTPSEFMTPTEPIELKFLNMSMTDLGDFVNQDIPNSHQNITFSNCGRRSILSETEKETSSSCNCCKPENYLTVCSCRLSKIIERVKSYEGEDICPITNDPLTPETIISILPCGHFATQNALKEWFGSSNTCPSCRSPSLNYLCDDETSDNQSSNETDNSHSNDETHNSDSSDESDSTDETQYSI